MKWHAYVLVLRVSIRQGKCFRRSTNKKITWNFKRCWQSFEQKRTTRILSDDKITRLVVRPLLLFPTTTYSTKVALCSTTIRTPSKLHFFRRLQTPWNYTFLTTYYTHHENYTFSDDHCTAWKLHLFRRPLHSMKIALFQTTYIQLLRHLHTARKLHFFRRLRTAYEKCTFSDCYVQHANCTFFDDYVQHTNCTFSDDHCTAWKYCTFNFRRRTAYEKCTFPDCYVQHEKYTCSDWYVHHENCTSFFWRPCEQLMKMNTYARHIIFLIICEFLKGFTKASKKQC